MREAEAVAATEEFEVWEPTVIIRGTDRFYEALVEHVQPLGQLAAGGAFYDRLENLQKAGWHFEVIFQPPYSSEANVQETVCERAKALYL